ncbi:MAG: hypothetical protein LBN05_08215 [Oscillospiraceae bacterium]|jgi:hypothetical protein|nr:hypothetical protein [Oscillospiraceae bacterium]
MNKQLPIPHALIDGMKGKNYEFDGAISFALESLGEKDYDYWFISGLTGDSFAQMYYRDHWRGNSAADVRCSDGDVRFVIDTIALCGYDCAFVPAQTLVDQRALYTKRLVESINSGNPVLLFWNHWEVCVGYEDDGEILLCVSGNATTPERIFVDKLFAQERPAHLQKMLPNPGWFFLGEKQEQKDLAGLYRLAITRLPALFAEKSEQYCFGAAAFRAWADEIENGKYDRMTAEEFSGHQWDLYTNFLCVLASNGSEYSWFLQNAQKLNPDMAFLEQISALYDQMGQLWGGEKPTKGCLEKIGGGFDVTLKVLQNKRKRAKIVAKIRECAVRTDEVVRLLTRFQAL